MLAARIEDSRVHTLESAFAAICYRDKSIIVWNLTHEEGTYGHPRRALKGHSHFVQDVVISSDGQFALSGTLISQQRLAVVMQHSCRAENWSFTSVSAAVSSVKSVPYRIMGWHTASVGPELRKHNQAIHWPHQGCAQRSFLCGQQTGLHASTSSLVIAPSLWHAALHTDQAQTNLITIIRSPAGHWCISLLAWRIHRQ